MIVQRLLELFFLQVFPLLSLPFSPLFPESVWILQISEPSLQDSGIQHKWLQLLTSSDARQVIIPKEFGISFSTEETHCVAQAVLRLKRENVTQGTHPVALFV